MQKIEHPFIQHHHQNNHNNIIISILFQVFILFTVFYISDSVDTTTSDTMSPAERNNNDPYNVLGVSPHASITEIRSAYKKAALQYHPDKQSNKNDIERIKAHETFTKINAAYELLSDPNKRYRYDQQLKQMQQQQYYDTSPESSFLRRYTTTTKSKKQAEPSVVVPNDDVDDAFSNNPFHFFDKVFREEFGSDIFGPRYQQQDSKQDDTMRDSFNDDMDIFNRHHNHHPVSIFGRHHHHDFFFGNIFREQEEMMKRMQEEMQQQQQQYDTNDNTDRNHNNIKQQYYSTSSSSSTIRNKNGETITTIEKVIHQNGLPPQKVKETIVRNKDGTIKERNIIGDEQLLAQSQQQNNNKPKQLPFFHPMKQLESSINNELDSINNKKHEKPKGHHNGWLPSWLTGGNSNSKTDQNHHQDKNNNDGKGTGN